MAKKRQENNKQRNVYLSNCITDHMQIDIEVNP
jgi:hypothetical protein